MESEKISIDDLIYKQNRNRHREKLYGYQGVKGEGNGIIGRLGLIYIHYHI